MHAISINNISTLTIMLTTGFGQVLMDIFISLGYIKVILVVKLVMLEIKRITSCPAISIQKQVRFIVKSLFVIQRDKGRIKNLMFLMSLHLVKRYIQINVIVIVIVIDTISLYLLLFLNFIVNFLFFSLIRVVMIIIRTVFNTAISKRHTIVSILIIITGQLQNIAILQIIQIVLLKIFFLQLHSVK